MRKESVDASVILKLLFDEKDGLNISLQSCEFEA